MATGYMDGPPKAALSFVMQLLLKIGGTWWPSERVFRSFDFTDGRGDAYAECEQRTHRYVEWPKSGSVWVVEYEAEEECLEPEVPTRLVVWQCALQWRKDASCSECTLVLHSTRSQSSSTSFVIWQLR